MTDPFLAALSLPAMANSASNTMNAPDLNASDLADDSGQLDLAEALFTAISHRNSQEALRLAAQIRSLDSHRDLSFGETPLLFAARHDLGLEALEALLARSNPLLTNKEGETALMLAAWGQQEHSFASVQLLLPLSDSLAANDGGSTALHVAIYYAQTKIISLLLPLSDLQQRNSFGRSPLDEARSLIDYPGDAYENIANLVLGEMARREAEELASAASCSPPAHARSPRL